MQEHVSPEGQEIERRFLIAETPPIPDEGRTELVRQGYLPDGYRLRHMGTRYFETMKSEPGLVRTEVEREILADEFEARWPGTEGARIEKVRTWIQLPGGFVAEYDVYHGALEGRRVVEVEFSSAEIAAAFVPPAWFGRELTGDGRYGNSSLARSGWPNDEAPREKTSPGASN